MTTSRPIGYWVKQLDRLIEESFERALALESLSRRHWQALNAIQPGPIGPERVDQALAPFLAGETASVRPVLDDLIGRGWVAHTDAGLALTGPGEDAVTRLAQVVGTVRSRLTADITPEQYLATVETLARMCENLERAIATS